MAWYLRFSSHAKAVQDAPKLAVVTFERAQARCPLVQEEGGLTRPNKESQVWVERFEVLIGVSFEALNKVCNRMKVGKRLRLPFCLRALVAHPVEPAPSL
eukprot:5094647-Pleurochrysis_carterae.AAC.1